MESDARRRNIQNCPRASLCRALKPKLHWQSYRVPAVSSSIAGDRFGLCFLESSFHNSLESSSPASGMLSNIRTAYFGTGNGSYHCEMNSSRKIVGGVRYASISNSIGERGHTTIGVSVSRMRAVLSLTAGGKAGSTL